MASTGVLVAGLLLGGAGGGVAVADPDDSTGTGQDASGSADAGGTDSGSEDSNIGPPEARVVAEVEPRNPASSGGGQTTDPAKSGRDGGRVGADRKPRRLTIYLPVPQAPKYNGNGTFDYPEESALNFVVIEAPVVKTVKTLRAILQPEPTPDPSFRGEEEPPVLEASGESDYAASGDALPRALEAPLVIAPPPIRPGAAPPGAAPPGAAPTPPQIAPHPAGPGTAPMPRQGAVPPGAEPPPAMYAAPTGSQMTRSGYRQYLRTATTADLALVALPGVMGLIAMTFSGGVIGYRQASAGRMLRTHAAARFLP